MNELEKSPLGKRTYATIKNAKKVDRLTNPAYEVQSQKADERIEKNNREYVKIYKRATFFYAK